MIIALFILLNILVPLSVSVFFVRKRKWYVHFISFPLATLISWFGVIESGISDTLGVFYYDNEAYDLETLTLMYYLGAIIPLVIILSVGVIMLIFQVIKKRNGIHPKFTKQ
jgi:hypothetical protein